MKKCIRCSVLKPLSAFTKHVQSACGLYSYCRTCISADAKKRRSTPRGALCIKLSCIRQRCYNPLNKNYLDYGGRGIKLCDRWMDADLFVSDILSTIGPPPVGMSLDRIDNNGDYSPGMSAGLIVTRSEQIKERNRAIALIHQER